MADIFGRNQTPSGVIFSSDRLAISIAAGGNSWVNALVQVFSSQYSQQVTNIPELGSFNVARSAGRPGGIITIEQIVGNPQNQQLLHQALYDACKQSTSLVIQGKINQCSGLAASMTLIYGGVLVTDVGISMTTQDLLVRRSLRLSFLSYNEKFISE